MYKYERICFPSTSKGVILCMIEVLIWSLWIKTNFGKPSFLCLEVTLTIPEVGRAENLITQVWQEWIIFGFKWMLLPFE